MSDTPETNSIIRNAQAADHPPTRLAATLTVKCEKLERERDEAQRLILTTYDALTPDVCDLPPSGIYSMPDKVHSLVAERDEARAELEEAQNKLKKTITELDLAGIEIFKWNRDFKILANDFKSFANRIKKQ